MHTPHFETKLCKQNSVSHGKKCRRKFAPIEQHSMLTPDRPHFSKIFRVPACGTPQMHTAANIKKIGNCDKCGKTQVCLEISSSGCTAKAIVEAKRLIRAKES